jgi:hypothetical protein
MLTSSLAGASELLERELLAPSDGQSPGRPIFYVDKGVETVIYESKTFPSGNIAFKVLVLTGRHAGQTTWILGRKNQAWAKVLKAGDSLKLPVTVRAVSAAPVSSEVAADLGGNLTHDPIVQVVHESENQSTIFAPLAPPKRTCSVPESPRSEPPPLPSVQNPYLTNCGFLSGEDHGSYSVDRCSRVGGVRDFSFQHGSDLQRYSRQWSFYTYGRTLKDLHFEVVNEDGDHDWSSPHVSYYLFPRRVVPSIHVHADGDSTVTLPTGETVEYNSLHEIVGGVLSEANSASFNGAPKISYSGTGVILSSGSHGVVPEGGSDGYASDGGVVDSEVVIKKQNYPNCRVPHSDVFVLVPKQGNASEKIGQFRFATDAEFDAFVQSHCGFSIY